MLNLLYTFWNLKQKKDILNYFTLIVKSDQKKKTKKTLYKMPWSYKRGIV